MAGKDEGDQIDTSTRLTGTVVNYEYRRGFGHVVPDGGSEEDKVFAHWKNIESADDWPSLKEGLKVEYYLGQHTQGQRSGQKFAAKITLPGGAKVSVGAEAKGRKILDASKRFTGTVKYWNQQRGFGWIKFDNDLTVAGETVPAKEDCYVPIDEIKTDDSPPGLKVGLEVEFTVYKGKGGFGAASVTAPGGGKLTVPWEDRSQGWGKRGWNNDGGWGQNKRPRYRISVNAGQAVVRLQIDSTHMGALIGPGGMNAKVMQDATGARFDFSDSWQPGPQCLALIGDDAALIRAVKEVTAKLQVAASTESQRAIFLVPYAVSNRVGGSDSMGLARLKANDDGLKVEMSENAVEVVGHGIFKQLAVAGPGASIGGALTRATKQLAITYDPKLDGYGGATNSRGWKNPQQRAKYLKEALDKGKVDEEMTDDTHQW